MPSRKPPTADELIATLATGLDKPDSALHWGTATSQVRREWRTTRTVAEKWLTDLVTAPNAELIAVWPTAGVVLQPERSPGDPARLYLTDLGWSDTEVMDLRFTASGSRKPANAKSGEPSCSDLFILRRNELKQMRRRIGAERQQRSREQAEQEAATLAEFRSRHGAALDIIASLLARVPLTHEFLRDNMVNPRVNNSKLAVSLHGGPDSLTIDLCGPEIEAFAALLDAQPSGSEVESS